MKVTELLKFYFVRPVITINNFADIADENTFQTIKNISLLVQADNWHEFSTNLKAKALSSGIELKTLFTVLRILITGNPKGMQLQDLFVDLGSKEFFERIKNIQF